MFCSSRMLNEYMHNVYILLFTLAFIFSCLPLNHASMIVRKVLKVGEELMKETMRLESGSTIYKLQRLQPHSWYEVKISYPASIPASFSIQLTRGNSDLGMNLMRKLLNTEKLIFKTDAEDLDEMHVMVNVEAEGFVAIRNARERTHVIFNIVCDERSLGIPHKAWWVVMCVLLCLVLAFIIPCVLPPYLFGTDRSSLSDNQIASKDS